MSSKFQDLLKDQRVLDYLKEQNSRPLLMFRRNGPKNSKIKNTLASSPTGSGKTLSYALPVARP